MKGGGGVMAYVSSSLSSKKLKLPRNFTGIKFGRHDAIVLGIYRPPKAVGKDYYLESDLHLPLCQHALSTRLMCSGRSAFLQDVIVQCSMYIPQS